MSFIPIQNEVISTMFSFK